MTKTANPDGLALPADNRRGPNCGVTALAVLSGATFAEAWGLMQRVNPRYGSPRWRGTTVIEERLRALQLLGLDAQRVELPRRMTLETFAARFAEPGARYMVTTTRHVQVLRDGAVVDQSGVKPVGLFWAKRKKVRSVYRVAAPAPAVKPWSGTGEQLSLAL